MKRYEKITLNGNEKILIMPPSGLGDFIKDLGIINSIKEKYPNIKIDISYINNQVEEISKFNKNINSLIKFRIRRFNFLDYLLYFTHNGWKDIGLLNKKKYDLIISLTKNPLRRFIIRFVKAKEKIMIESNRSNIKKEYGCLDILKINKISKKDFLDNNIVNRINVSWEITNYLSKEKKNLIVNMFCADSPKSQKDWDKWEELIDYIKKDYNIILIGKVNFDYKKYYKIDYNKVIDLINKTNIEETVFLINKSDIIISVDSFIFHLSYALNKKTIGLFGPYDPNYLIPKVKYEEVITLFSKSYGIIEETKKIKLKEVLNVIKILQNGKN